MLGLLLFAVLATGLPFESPLDGRRHSRKELPDLKFRHNGTFQITVFSDFHLGEMPAVSKGPARDLKTIQVMGDVLDYDKPDFVVLNGDLLTGEAAPKRKRNQYIDQLLKPLVERNLTWGSTYGDHDHTFTLRSEKIFRREHRYAGSRTQKMVKNKRAGTSNYYLPVYAADCFDPIMMECQPVLLLWFFDSRGGYYYKRSNKWGNPVAQPNWVDVSVVKWFLKTNQELSKAADRTIPALAFVHIPIKATDSSQHRIDPHKNPGINDDKPVSQQGRSWCDHKTHDTGALGCTYGGHDMPFMTALATTPGLMGLFYGHDHGNTWCHRWDSQIPGTNLTANGLNLCYGQHTGYGGYGNWIRGGRRIIVRGDQSMHLTMETHVRLENGKTVGAVVLNSTFNEDWYPSTPNEKTHLEDGMQDGAGQRG